MIDQAHAAPKVAEPKPRTHRMHPQLAAIAIFLLPVAAAAQSTTLTAGDTTITVPAPSGYTYVAGQSDEYFAVYQTTPVEPWEEIGEFSEEILISAIPFASDDPAVIAERFAAMFASLYTYALAEQAGTDFRVDANLVNEELFRDIATFSAAGSASTVTVSANSDKQKALVFDTGFVLPGVVTYPVVEEFSFVLVGDVMVIIRAQRVPINLRNTQTLQLDPRVTQDLRQTGAALREGLLAAN